MCVCGASLLALIIHTLLIYVDVSGKTACPKVLVIVLPSTLGQHTCCHTHCRPQSSTYTQIWYNTNLFTQINYFSIRITDSERRRQTRCIRLANCQHTDVVSRHLGNHASGSRIFNIDIQVFLEQFERFHITSI